MLINIEHLQFVCSFCVRIREYILCVDDIEKLKLRGGFSSIEVENIDIEFIKCVDNVDETRC